MAKHITGSSRLTWSFPTKVFRCVSQAVAVLSFLQFVFNLRILTKKEFYLQKMENVSKTFDMNLHGKRCLNCDEIKNILKDEALLDCHDGDRGR